MTKEDKNKIYRLLKTASDSIYGYSSPDFAGEMPEFQDDVGSDGEAGKTCETGFERVSTEAVLRSCDNDGGLSSESTLSHINKKIAECKRCALCANRRNVVPGMGVENPFVLVIGEGPGEEEDKQGKPFVGPAGQLLDKMLAAIGLSREKNCYIANIVKCRPPANRNPMNEEADACRPFLDAQIAALKPRAILCAGSVAVKNLFHSEDGVMKLHGKILDFNGIPVVTTWHPSALLRAPENKRAAWEDLKVFRTLLLSLSPDYDK